MVSRTYFLFCLLFCSCATAYLPTVRNVPVFSQKGDFQACASVGNGVNLQAGYALTNHLALTAGGLYADDTESSVKEPNLFIPGARRIHKSVEGAVGYYRNKGSRVFEVFGGYGVGRGEASLTSYGFFFVPGSVERIDVSYQKLYIQPSFGIKRSRIELIWTIRVSRVDFNSITLSRNENLIPIYKTDYYFLEPSFTTKIIPVRKVPALFLFGQAGITVDTNLNKASEFDYSYLQLSVGIGFRLIGKTNRFQ